MIVYYYPHHNNDLVAITMINLIAFTLIEYNNHHTSHSYISQVLLVDTLQNSLTVFSDFPCAIFHDSLTLYHDSSSPSP